MPCKGAIARYGIQDIAIITIAIITIVGGKSAGISIYIEVLKVNLTWEKFLPNTKYTQQLSSSSQGEHYPSSHTNQ